MHRKVPFPPRIVKRDQGFTSPLVASGISSLFFARNTLLCSLEFVGFLRSIFGERSNPAEKLSILCGFSSLVSEILKRRDLGPSVEVNQGFFRWIVGKFLFVWWFSLFGFERIRGEKEEK